MPLIRNGSFEDCTFARTGDEGDLPAGAVIVSLKRWQAERAVLEARNTPLGLRLASDQSPELLGADVHHFALIELEFPKFRDGRGYTSARVLRDRHGYKGEIRAVGDVLRDQWLFMQRCGVDAFEVKEGTRIEDFRAALAEQTVFYQRSADGHPSIFELRHSKTQA
jgi:uncharacterized protein (DUF934 family)